MVSFKNVSGKEGGHGKDRYTPAGKSPGLPHRAARQAEPAAVCSGGADFVRGHRPGALPLVPEHRADARAEAAGAQLLLSIHLNYDADSRVSGFECCPATPQLSTNADSLRFARLVAEKFGAIGMELRGIDGVRYIYFDDNDNRYIRESNDTTVLSDPTFTVVQKCGCPAVLVEEGFITNAGDVALVATDAACEAAAQAYYECILTYFDLT